MSHVATSWLAGLTGLSASEFRVLFHLCDCHNPARGCFPTQAYLVEKCECASSTVNLALKGLEDRGLLRRIVRFDDVTKKRKSTMYQFAFEADLTPNIGDGPNSDLGADLTPIYDESHLRPIGDKPVKGTRKEPVSVEADASGLFSESETGDLLEHALRIYRGVAKEAGWPDIRAWTPDRRSQLGARLKECGGLTGWEREMRRAATCPHLIGKNDRGWKASLDFFLRKDKFLKLMEGGYDGPTFTKPADPGPSRGHRASAPQWGEVVR
jgi:hypothetical protein